MLRVAGLGVCLKNGTQDTLAIADVITEFDCDEDGAGRYSYDYVLNSN